MFSIYILNDAKDEERRESQQRKSTRSDEVYGFNESNVFKAYGFNESGSSALNDQRLRYHTTPTPSSREISKTSEKLRGRRHERAREGV